MCSAQQVNMQTPQGLKMQGSTQEATAPKHASAIDASAANAAATACPAATCKLRYRLVPYPSECIIVLSVKVRVRSCWLRHLGPHIIQVYMAHTLWAQWCVGGSNHVVIRLVPTPLHARQCSQLLGSPGGCTRWISPRCHASPGCSTQQLSTNIVFDPAWLALAQVHSCGTFDTTSSDAIAPDSQLWITPDAPSFGTCCGLLTWKCCLHAVSYRLMLSLAGVGNLVQITIYCNIGHDSEIAYLYIWYVPTVPLYWNPIHRSCSDHSDHSIRCGMPTPRTGRSPLPRRRQTTNIEQGAVDPLSRAPLQRTRSSSAPASAKSATSAKTARTPLPRLRPRAARDDTVLGGGAGTASAARKPAQKKARPQPKLHPWTHMVSLDQVVFRPGRQDKHTGRSTMRAHGTDDAEDDSSSEDVRVCTTPVVSGVASLGVPTQGASRDSRARIRFKPRPVPPSKEEKMKTKNPGNQRGGLMATGARAKQKARQCKIRGSLRECLRVGNKPKAKTKAMPTRGKQGDPWSEGPSTASASTGSGPAHSVCIPPASQQTPTHARLDMEAVAVLEPTDWTVVTEQKLPADIDETPEATTAGMQDARSQETKEALLRWQREQFVQKAELVRMQAAMRDVSHPNPKSSDASAYMGLPAYLHIAAYTPVPLRSVLPVFASTAAARWSPAMPLLPLLTLRSSVWKWQLPLWSREWSWPLSTRSLPYSECDQLTLMHGVCCIVPYRLRLCTYMLSRRILIVMRLCVGILLVWWRALFGTCLCGLRCKRWTFLARRFRRSPHPRCDTKLHIPISRSAIPPPDVHRCRLGPKSEANRRALRIHSVGAVRVLFLLLCIAQLLIHPVGGVRVAADSTPAAGVHEHEAPTRAKQLAAKPSGITDIRAQPVFTHARKRAYKRALVRAQAQGVTSYRGRRLTLQQLAGAQGEQTIADRTHRQRQGSHIDQPRHPCVLSWNVGGLSNSILDELFLWLALPQNRCIKIVLLQETRWQFSSEWESESWYIIHAGHSKQKGAGIMTLISKDLCSAEDIRSNEAASGRVLHTRVPGAGGHSSLDVINVYQHAWDQRADAVELKRKRSRILEKVDVCIQQIPWRNLCICAGDWNVQLEPMSNHVGNTTTLLAGHRQSAPDVEALVDVLVAKQLVAVNTWSGSRRHAFTFEHRGYRSQIDYVFARRHQVTQLMRQCRPIADFPVTAWRQSGLHRPLLMQLDYRWKPHGRTAQGRRIDHDAIATAVAQQTPQLQAFQQDVQLALSRNPEVDTLDLHQVLYDCCLQHFPAVPTRRDFAHNHPDVRQVVHNRWAYLQRGRYYRRFAAEHLLSAWRCWHNFARFRALRRAANKASRIARRQRVDHLLQAAETHAQANNTHKLYAIIRQLAPKQPFCRVKIYGLEGEVLTREAEADRLRTHFRDIFQGEAEPWEHPCAELGVPPPLADIRRALESTPLRKAVPRHFAPGAAWRAAASLVAPIVHHTVCQAWESRTIPRHWQDGWLVLMKKPAKPGRGPGDYRPLCLQDPAGKAVIGLVAERIRPQIKVYADRIPQHAYLAGRSAEGALLNVFSRCRQIRELTQQAGNSVFARRAGRRSAPYAGGIMLSLDMTTAFDTVPRVLIRDSLLAAGICDADVSIIMAWMSGATYHLTHAHVDLHILTQRGVRQGCKLSPLIWACYTCYITTKLAHIIDIADLQIFADDFLWSRIFSTRQQFFDALDQIPRLLKMMQHYGLTINVNKTAVLIRMAQQEGKQLLKQHVCSTSKGQYLCFLGGELLRIPLKRSHVYLGCVISLFDFENLTVRHRLCTARNQFSRLRTVLTSTRCLSLKRRAQIWKTCIWTTLMYGWSCCGCSGYLLSQVFGLVNTQLRAIARSPRHITHTTNEDVYRMLGVPNPARLVQLAVWSLSRRLAAPCTEGDTIMRGTELQEQATWAADLLQEAVLCSGRLERVITTQGVACTVCGVYFANETDMRKHRTRKHPEAERVSQIDTSNLQREAYCVDGMPVCRGCGKSFHHMHTLLRHIRHQRCPGLQALGQALSNPHDSATSAADTEPLPLFRRTDLVMRWSEGGISALLQSLREQTDLRKELMQHCCICRQWNSDPRRFKTHVQKSHPEMHAACHESAVSDCKGLEGSLMCPCEYCGQSFTKKARHVVGCPVLYQATLACRAHGRAQQRECRLSIRGCVADCKPDTAGSSKLEIASHTDAWTGQGQIETHRAATEVPKGQGQGSKGQKDKGGIRSFFTRQPRDPTTVHDGANLPAPRRCHSDSSVGQGVLRDVQDQGRGDNFDNHQRSGHTLGGAQRGQEDGLFKAHCPVERRSARAANQNQIDGSQRRQGSQTHRAGLGHQAGSQGADVAATCVERGAAEGSASSGHGAVAALAGGTSPGHDPGACLQSSGAEVSCDATHGAHIQGGDDRVHTRDQHERIATSSGARGADDVEPFRHLVVDRCPNETGAPQALCHRQAATALARQRVLALSLRNTGNICYQNAFAMAWLWAVIWASSFQVDGHAPRELRRCVHLVATLLNGACDSLVKAIPWSAILQGWSRPHRQHDVGAFACHALAKLRNDLMFGNWIARLADPISRDLDSGPQHLPITVVIPEGASSIQECIQAWHQQHTLHALGVAPPLLVLQLGRFRQRASRHVAKYRGILTLQGVVNMPCYNDAQQGLDVHMVPYKIISGVFHIGATPSSGHYRALLSEAGDEQGFRNLGVPDCILQNAFETDDHRAPRQLDPTEHDLVLTNMYLVWLLKLPPEHS